MIGNGPDFGESSGIHLLMPPLNKKESFDLMRSKTLALSKLYDIEE